MGVCGCIFVSEYLRVGGYGWVFVGVYLQVNAGGWGFVAVSVGSEFGTDLKAAEFSSGGEGG